jgi:hypothetical protein
MTLEEVPMKGLLHMHNGLTDKPAGPKSFRTKTDLIARLGKLQPAPVAPRRPARPRRPRPKTPQR